MTDRDAITKAVEALRKASCYPLSDLTRATVDDALAALTALQEQPATDTGSLLAVAERCSKVLSDWAVRVCDPDRDGLRVISDFCWALGVTPTVTLAALQLSPAPVGVRPLEWVDDGKYINAYHHELRLGYEIQRRTFGSLWQRYPGNDWLPSNTEDEVELKARMQADYERRILTALQPSPAREEADDKYQAAKRKVWGGAPVAETDTQLEAEALVKRLRDPDFWLQGRRASHDDAPYGVADFIARHHLGEKS